ncbi:calcium-binding protein, partial [Nostoc parmelioides]
NTVNGGLGDDNITAGAGNDALNGGDGNDNIQGGAGNDILTGSAGKDVLVGGLGSDRFDYKNLNDSLLANFDLVTDFNSTIGNDIFLVSSARTAFTNVGAVASLDTAGISAKLTDAFFIGNAAAQFTLGSRTFVAINDATDGFNTNTDAIIEVTSLTGTLGLSNFTTV